MKKKVLLFVVLGLVLCNPARPDTISYDRALEFKEIQLKKAASNAVEQQRKTSLDKLPLKVIISAAGNVKVDEIKGWDRDGDGKSYEVRVRDIPGDYNLRGERKNYLHVSLDKPMDFLNKATGISFWVKAPENLSSHLRFGLQIYSEGNDGVLRSYPDMPVVHKFGDNPHHVYFDLASFSTFKQRRERPPRDFFRKITGFDIVIIQKKIPGKPQHLEPVSGSFNIDAFSLEDIYNGSFNSDRFPKDGSLNARMDPGARYQQVTRVVAGFGGTEGRESALRSLDLMARLQSWDGSWPAGNALQGETTFGMILKDLSFALLELRKAEMPSLDDTVSLKHWKMKREDLYEQMLFRAAMARGPGPVNAWHDSHYNGHNSMINGCNRSMVYIASQWITASILQNRGMAEAIMAQYNVNMDTLLTYQGRTSGGWPIFGESNRVGKQKYGDGAIHYDAPYTMDHIQIMAFAARVTGDKRWQDMMRKFDAIVPAMVLKDGQHWDFGLSERHPEERRRTTVKTPDIVYQEAMRANAMNLAQLAYNNSKWFWENWPQKMWNAAGKAKGYVLGAFTSSLVSDMVQDPAPADVGIVFPRQMPVYTVRWTDKNSNQVVRTSSTLIDTEGNIRNNTDWEVGQYPNVTGLPLNIVPDGGRVTIEVIEYTGKGLPGKRNGSGKIEGGEKFKIKEGTGTVSIKGPSIITVNSGKIVMRFKAEPADTGNTLTLNLAFQTEVDRTRMPPKELNSRRNQ